MSVFFTHIEFKHPVESKRLAYVKKFHFDRNVLFAFYVESDMLTLARFIEKSKEIEENLECSALPSS